MSGFERQGIHAWASSIHGPLQSLLAALEDGDGQGCSVDEGVSRESNGRESASNENVDRRECQECEQHASSARTILRVVESKGIEAIIEDTGTTEQVAKEGQTQYDALLATPFLCERGAAAALAAVGIQACRYCEAVDRARGVDNNKAAEVVLEPRLLAAAIRQDRYLLRDGKQIKLWNQVSGLYKVGDGRHIQLHCNFEKHCSAALKVLGIPGRKESMSKKDDGLRSSVQAAILKRNNVFELEEEMVAAGACAAAVRTPQEWNRHPQREHVANLPVVCISNIDCTEKAQRRHVTQPSRSDAQDDKKAVLKGIKVLDISRVLAGPMAGRTLADFGAQVTRISSPDLESLENLVLATGHGKCSRSFRFDQPKELADFRTLLHETDVVINAYRPGCLDRFGLSSEELARDFPGLVVIELSAFSHVGPWRLRRGFDSLLQCITGLVDEQSKAIGSDFPQHLPVQFLDYVTGYLGAACAMQALVRRERDASTNLRSYIGRLSLCQTAEWLRSLGRKSPNNTLWPIAANVPAESIADLFIETALPGTPGVFHGTKVITSLGVPLRWNGWGRLGPSLGCAPVPLAGSPLSLQKIAPALVSGYGSESDSDNDDQDANSTNNVIIGQIRNRLPYEQNEEARDAKRARKTLPKFSTDPSTNSPTDSPQGQSAKVDALKDSRKMPMRIRNFPHVHGNWPMFFSIQASIPPNIMDLAKQFLDAVALQVRPQGGLSVFLVGQPHLSLSRTFPVREHTISPIISEVARSIESLAAFTAHFSGFKLYFSDNKSRLFAAAVVGRGKPLCVKAINCVDAVLGSWGEPLFYENPEPHVSLCWIDLDPVVDAPKAVQIMPALAAISPEGPTSQFQFHVGEVHAQAGDKITKIRLKISQVA